MKYKKSLIWSFFFLFVCLLSVVFIFSFQVVTSSENGEISKSNELSSIYVNSKTLLVGDTQLVAVGFNNGENAASAKLSYTQVNCQSTTVDPIETTQDFAIFSLPFKNHEQAGLYTLDKVSWGNNSQNYEMIDTQYVNGYSFCVSDSTYKSDSTDVKVENLNSINNDTGEVLENDNSILMMTPNVQESVYNYQNNRENGFVVAIDPGHGGSDSGACYGSYQEKWLNLRISYACYEELLLYSDVTPYMTRTGDEYVGLQERVERARANGANLFLCLHNNSGGGHGAEVWIQHSGGWHSEFNSEGADIGMRIIQKLQAQLGLGNRGLKERYCTDGSLYPDGSLGDYFTVLFWSRYYSIPAILVEHAFMDGGGADADALYNDENLNLMGFLDAQSVAEHYGFSKFEPKPYAKDITEDKTTLAWEEVPGAEKYCVSIYEDGKYDIKDMNVRELEYTFFGLEIGKTYNFLVQSYRNGSWSSIAVNRQIHVQILPRPKPYVIDDKSVDGAATIGWKTISCAEKYAISERLPDGTFDIRTLDFVCYDEYATYTINNLANGFGHQILVQACTNGNWSALHNYWNDALVHPEGKMYPDITSTSSDLHSINVKWNTVAGASKFAISTSLDELTWTIHTLECKNLEYTIAGLASGKQYKVLVQAFIMGNWTSIELSDSRHVTTKFDYPLDVKALSKASGTVTLGWSKVNKAERYCVSRFRNDGSFEIYNMNVTDLSYTISNLANGYSHFFLVQAYCEGSWSSCTDLSRLYRVDMDDPSWPRIANINFTNSTSSSITVSWDECPGATSYAVSTSKFNEPWVIHTLEAKGNSYIVNGLQQDLTYTILVQAYVMGQWTLISESDFRYVSTLGTSPKNIHVDKMNSGYVKLAWDKVEGASKYCVSRYNNGSFEIYDMDWKQNTFEIYNLANGYTHYFLVQACVNGTWSTWTDFNKLLPVTLDNPDWPRIAHIENFESTSSSITINWESCPGSSSYAVSTRKYNEPWHVHTLTATGNSFVINNLESDITYEVLVQSYVMGQWTLIDSSDSVFVSTYGNSPKNVHVIEKSSGTVKLGWDPVLGADKYCVSRYHNGAYEIYDMNVKDTNFKFENLANGITHYFLVQACVDGVWSTCYDLNKLYSVELNDPSWPTIAKIKEVSATSTSISVSWEKCPGAVYYAVSTARYNEPWVIHTLTCTDNQFTINNLIEDASYTVLVQSFVMGSWTLIDKSDSVSTSTNGISPKNVHTVDVQSGTITLGWDSVLHAEKYCISRYLGNGKFEIYSMGTFATNFTISDLGNGYTYQFLVQAYVGGVWSTCQDLGKLITVSLDNPSWPTKPQNVSVTSDQYNTIKVSWDRLTGAKYYAVSTKQEGTSWVNNTLSCYEMSFTIPELHGGETYTIVVQGRVENDWTAFDESKDCLTIVVKRDYNRPKLAIDSVGYNSAALSWNSISGASKYRIVYRNSDGSYEILRDNITNTSISIYDIESRYYYFGVQALLSNSNWSDIDGGDLIYVYIPAYGKTPIMSDSRTYALQIANYFMSKGHPYPSWVYADKGAPNIYDFATICCEEGSAEGVDPAVLFCQSMHETGWLQFGGLVQPWQCNFGGLGATGTGVYGAVFPDVRTGLRAQVQHLKCYASILPLNYPLVDQRWDAVIEKWGRGSAPCVEDLNGKWAVPGENYGQRIVSLMRELFCY